MRRSRRTFSAEFKAEAVKLITGRRFLRKLQRLFAFDELLKQLIIRDVKSK